MKKLQTLVVAFAFAANMQVKADEGMWLLPLIEKLNIKDMARAGCELTADRIYDLNNTSLKDAVVIFGGGCTGEVVSDQGLVLTNHHCGYGAIQQHSSVENDYLKDGFWAKTKEEEIYTPRLQVTFLERIEDVTDKIVPAVQDLASESEREKKVSEISDAIKKSAVGDNSSLRATVTSMMGGNNYYLFVYKTYPDIRMVGAPPSSIGKFGGETDNWMWPRHTGDFSLFRIYADAAGNPAEYSPTNIPLKPKYHIPVSLKGAEENDFAMVLGFPGRTQRYMTSWEVAQRISVENANRIKIRGIRQELMMDDMQADPKVRIQYASKYSGSSNYRKNSIGMNKALKKLKVIDLKRAQETEFTGWIGNNADRKQKFGDALSLIESSVTGRADYLNASQYLNECILNGCEVVSFGARMVSLYEAMKKPQPDSVITAQVDALKRSADEFFKDYNMPTDKKIMKAMLKLYTEDVSPEFQPEIFAELKKEYDGDYDKYTEDLFAGTFLTDPEKVKAFLDNPSLETSENDPGFRFALSARKKSLELGDSTKIFTEKFGAGHRKYVAGLEEMYKGRKFLYPDANFTMRLTYGKVGGYKPADAVYYEYFTALEGVTEKEDPENPEFEVPDKLKELYAKKDFGPYATKDGRMPVNFIFDGDITGGNSGSPVFNGKGELIGTAFDGNWEAMSGDIAFEKEMQRCISVDIRYILFIIDKFAEAKHLTDEMTIVK